MKHYECIYGNPHNTGFKGVTKMKQIFYDLCNGFDKV